MRALLLILLVSCEPATPEAQSPAHAPDPPNNAIASPEPRFTAAVHAVATQYPHWGRVDQELRAAPIPCAAGSPAPKLYMSAADNAPHGRKLYYLSASDRVRYREGTTFPAGFAVVKESYVAVPDKHGVVGIDGTSYSRGERRELFVMTKLADRAGTDDGWIYGTVAVDGTVTGAGRIASCMECHDHDATHERLFVVR